MLPVVLEFPLFCCFIIQYSVKLIWPSYIFHFISIIVLVYLYFPYLTYSSDIFTVHFIYLPFSVQFGLVSQLYFPFHNFHHVAVLVYLYFPAFLCLADCYCYVIFDLFLFASRQASTLVAALPISVHCDRWLCNVFLYPITFMYFGNAFTCTLAMLSLALFLTLRSRTFITLQSFLNSLWSLLFFFFLHSVFITFSTTKLGSIATTERIYLLTLVPVSWTV